MIIIHIFLVLQYMLHIHVMIINDLKTIENAHRMKRKNALQCFLVNMQLD